jgi:hypothetical protein
MAQDGAGEQCQAEAVLADEQQLIARAVVRHERRIGIACQRVRMPGDRQWVEHAGEPGGAGAMTPIDLLGVDEEALVEHADRAERRAPHQQGAPGDEVHLGRLAKLAAIGLAHAAMPRPSAHQLAAGGQDASRLFAHPHQRPRASPRADAIEAVATSRVRRRHPRRHRG